VRGGCVIATITTQTSFDRRDRIGNLRQYHDLPMRGRFERSTGVDDAVEPPATRRWRTSIEHCPSAQRRILVYVYNGRTVSGDLRTVRSDNRWRRNHSTSRAAELEE
jgi:hypothetical protein